MATNSVAGLTSQANGENTPERVSGSGRSSRHRSESETETGPTLKSFARLCSRDEAERAAALEELSQEVLMCLGLDQPRLSKLTLLHLLRLSRSCPLQEVRGRATELLRTAQVMFRWRCSALHRVDTGWWRWKTLIEQQWGRFFLNKHLNNW